ncbi:MAG: hypothetical protein IT299_09675 [Dehalococcoidia bacterium]|nr:hypothetical protein [Dehalococcoidia bacterium]
MAHALEGSHQHTHACEACAAPEPGSTSLLARLRRAVVGWLAYLNGTPVADISRGDLGAIRRLAEA